MGRRDKLTTSTPLPALDIALHFLLDQVEDILICAQACTIVMVRVRTVFDIFDKYWTSC
jgi:hypothetical protein